MADFPEHDLLELNERLRNANAVTAELMAEVVGQACQRFPLMGESENTARLQRLIATGAWTDAALALVNLELPLWRVRRLAYDEGEWYCALSRQRELPDWLDQSIEGRHADLALAILTALVNAKASAAPARRTSAPLCRARRARPTIPSAAIILCDAAPGAQIGRIGSARVAGGDLLGDDRLDIGCRASKPGCQFPEGFPLGLVGSQPADEVAILGVGPQLFQLRSEVLHSVWLEHVARLESSKVARGENFVRVT